MSALRVYLDTRYAESVNAWYDADKLTALDAQVRAEMGSIYRFLDGIATRVGELRGPTGVPRKASSRTDFQRGYAEGVKAAGGEKA